MAACFAVIVAGGSGRRLGGEPKQFRIFGDKPMLAHSLQAFQDCPQIDKIIVVAPQSHLETVHQLAFDYDITKFHKAIEGGETRQESVFRGISDIDDSAIILIHDAARPFIRQDLIGEIISKTNIDHAAIPAIAIIDTIKIVGDDLCIAQTPPRERLFAAQTPQGFLGQIIKKAHIKAKEDSFVGSDDASLVERLGISVKLILHNQNNMKITTKEDFQIGEFILTSNIVG